MLFDSFPWMPMTPCRPIQTRTVAALAFSIASAGAFAQHTGHQGRGDVSPPDRAPGKEPAAVDLAPARPSPKQDHSARPDHQMPQGHSMSGEHSADHGEMRSPFGPYPMSRDASGTSWQPEATPMEGIMWKAGAWDAMLHGFVYGVHDRQGGPRGDTKIFAESMLMVMGHRPAGGGTLGLRAMLSLDAAMGKGGYPLLFQTGETADGRRPLVDRQHPHDAFMELSASYSLPLGDAASAFAYVGLPGEPALGPPTFMHRFSGIRIPEAPLTHHWLDSTHITFGVVTLGAVHGAWKAEGSWFNGREPDQHRWNIETRRLDSWSTRVSYNPSPNWSMQASYGDLESPELLEPETRVRRATASGSYHAKMGSAQCQSTLAWGRNEKRSPEGEARLPGWLLESSCVMDERHTLFGRFERVKNDELFDEESALHGRAFAIKKLSVGYVYDFAKSGPVKWGVGGLASAYRKPAELDAHYGSHPYSLMVFVQARL
jgi:hypothetical protein